MRRCRTRIQPRLRRTAKLVPILTVLGLLIIVPHGWSQASNPSEVFAHLTQAIIHAKQVFRRGEELSLAAAITESSNQILDRLSASNVSVSGEFLRTLRFDADLLVAATSNPESEQRLAELRAVDLDLKPKANYATHGLGATAHFVSLVDVVVTTQKDGQNASNYYVQCSNQLFPNVESPRFNFNNPTNPTTTASLPPGYYVMWAVKGSFKSNMFKETVSGGMNPQPITLDLSSN
jgi:hypothetical protein